MRHSKARLQLNRFTSWRDATLISLAKAVIIHQRIKTTSARAKAVKPLVEKLISLGKSNSLAAKRQAYRILGEHKLVSELFNNIAARFANRNGGYCRILNLDSRRGDNAKIVMLALTEIQEIERRKPKTEAEKKEPKERPEVTKEEIQKERLPQEQKPKVEAPPKERPPISTKPTKKFLGGLRKIFKKERDSL